jgi:dTDP-4-amino-4,6-dideoxygalactose transaminase
MILFNGLQRQYQTLKEEILESTDTVLSSGKVLDGKYTHLFEQEIAKRCNRRYAIAVNSCSQALIFSQSALNIDGNVIIPTTSFIATLNSILMSNNIPIFCDVDNNALLDIKQLGYSLGITKIESIVYVNLYGNVLNYDYLLAFCRFWNRDTDIKIIEDAAQSFGASYNGIPSGKLGDISVLSFDPTKNLPNYGSGGMILTDSTSAAETCYDLRDNGKYNNHIYPGTNSKMSELDCAHMLIKLKYFDDWQKRRQDIAKYYNERLPENINLPHVESNVVHAWHKYVIQTDERNELQEYLTLKDITTKIHYDTPLPYSNLGIDYYSEDVNSDFNLFESSVRQSKESLSLPIYPEMTDSEVESVVTTIKSYYTL